MNKFLRIVLISLASLFVALFIAVCVVIWLVFTPEKITSIVKKQAVKYLTCPAKIGSVELTFFSTFPHFGLQIDNLSIINPIEGSPSDTLIAAEKVIASIDILSWWKNGDYLITDLKIANGIINVFTDSLSKSNYLIFNDKFASSDSSAKVQEPDSPNIRINLDKAGFENVNLSYIDRSLKILFNAKNFTAYADGSFIDNVFKGNFDIPNGVLTFDYANEAYLQDFQTNIKVDADFDLSMLRFLFNSISGTINNVDLNLNGFVEYQSKIGNTKMELVYKLKPSNLNKVLDLVPPSFRHYYNGFEMKGIISSEGKISGNYNENEMPYVDIKANLENGSLAYEGIALRLNDVFSDIKFASDLSSDEKTMLIIDRFEAKTDKSRISSKGHVKQLFSDIFCDLNSYFDLNIDEFVPLMPSELGLNVSGNAVGNAKTSFTLSQIENFEFDKIKASGALTLKNFSLGYDTISAFTNKTNIEFAMPNPVPLSSSTGFAYMRLNIDSLNASTVKGSNAFIKNGLFVAEMSDFRDSTRLPSIICSFKADSLAGRKDTICVSLSVPLGKVNFKPQEGNPLSPDVNIVYSNRSMAAEAGKNRALMGRFILNGSVLSQSTGKDIFSKWLINADADVQNAIINTEFLSEQIDIPSVKVAFDNENLDIEKGDLKIGGSDFKLTGKVSNLMSYYKGDSILKGDLNFESNNTNISQLMNMTNGIGNDKNNSVSSGNNQNIKADTVFSGPYMVPKGIDIILNTNIASASFGEDIASNIRGQVRVYDGTLVLDEMKLSTPAAQMQLTAMYRTPRKNHLFLGIDYHMIDVEISELLRMIPDIDSIMPMLRSFGGKGEFHLAAETYLDSTYKFKISTLLGAASITGQNLVLMDGETFSEIAKTLRFSKQTKNRVDSISAEFTVFRDEIDIYPFLVVMDKYNAVVAGRHNLDMSFDYHISLVKSPLPVKLGVDVKGKLGDLKIRPVACKYAEFYRPVSRKAVQNKQLELRKLIRESLIKKVSE